LSVRSPRVAGQFYPGDVDSLRTEIESCFTHDLGPGEPPEEPGDTGEVVGIVVPNAGYAYSGPVAACSYSTLYRDRAPDSFVILGPNHQGAGSGVALYPKGAWKTPLGIAQIDEELTGAILDATGIIDMDERAHAYEHSIEVQLPFLQYLYGDVKIAPISMMMQDLETALEVGGDIADAVDATGTDAAVIASTDFSHYVPADTAKKQDRLVIDRIVDMDPEGVYRVVQENRITMCGYGPVIAAIESSSSMGATEGELIRYATSGDVTPMREVVGYGSLAFRMG